METFFISTTALRLCPAKGAVERGGVIFVPRLGMDGTSIYSPRSSDFHAAPESALSRSFSFAQSRSLAFTLLLLIVPAACAVPPGPFAVAVFVVDVALPV